MADVSTFKFDPGVLNLLTEIFREPTGHTPLVEGERTQIRNPLDDSFVDADLYTVTPGTVYAKVGLTPNTYNMFAPQDYIFTEVTMGAREFVVYLRDYADEIEARLPSLNHPSQY